MRADSTSVRAALRGAGVLVARRVVDDVVLLLARRAPRRPPSDPARGLPSARSKALGRVAGARDIASLTMIRSLNDAKERRAVAPATLAEAAADVDERCSGVAARRAVAAASEDDRNLAFRRGGAARRRRATSAAAEARERWRPRRGAAAEQAARAQRAPARSASASRLDVAMSAACGARRVAVVPRPARPGRHAAAPTSRPPGGARARLALSPPPHDERPWLAARQRGRAHAPRCRDGQLQLAARAATARVVVVVSNDELACVLHHLPLAHDLRCRGMPSRASRRTSSPTFARAPGQRAQPPRAAHGRVLKIEMLYNVFG